MSVHSHEEDCLPFGPMSKALEEFGISTVIVILVDNVVVRKDIASFTDFCDCPFTKKVVCLVCEVVELSTFTLYVLETFLKSSEMVFGACLAF